MAPARAPVAGSGKKAGKSAGKAAGKPAGTPAANQAGGNKATGQQRGRQAAWQARRRRNRLLAVGSVVVVVAVIAVLVVVGLGSNGTSGPPREPAPAAVISKLTSLPLATLVQASADKSLGLNAPQGAGGSGAHLISAGKPELLFIGAEFCPVCATERWSMLVALSYFGKFSNVSETHSAVRDGDIPTLSFYGSTYTSPYLVFTPVETTTNQPVGNYYKTLETPTPAEAAIWKADSPSGEAFPFIDIAGQWLLQTAQYSPTLLEGHSFSDIANSIGSNENTIGVNADASAAVLIKAICAVTGQKPAATCSAVAGVSMGASSSTGTSSPAGS